MESKYNIALWLDQWLINDLGLDPVKAMYIKLPILMIGLLIISYLAYFITVHWIVGIINKLIKKTKNTWDDVLIEKRVFHRLSVIVPIIIFAFSFPYIFGDFPSILKYVLLFSDVFFVGVVVWTVNAFLAVLDEVLSELEPLKDKPITSYIQVIKIIVYFTGGILMLSILLGKSPFYFLGAMGAMTAILLLIFKDTILGFVASIQMSVYDMIRVGDWVAMPKYDADGDVMSINLNTVKIQNWDKTITTIPTYAFITDSFKNWRGMTDSGGRRIKRSILLKVSSFKFLDKSMIEKFKNYSLIKQYIIEKELEIDTHNASLESDESVSVNSRRLTNVGVFRIYAERYISSNPNIHKGLTSMVRQLDPTSKGLPLEIYCFSADIRWVHYENIMADIFDHLLTIATEFQLEVFEDPTGKDFSKGLSDTRKELTH